MMAYMRVEKLMKMLGMLLGVSSIGLLAGCSSSSSSSPSAAATYKIDYSDQISANGASNSKLNIDVNKANLMASVSQAKDETYSIEITKNPNILVHNNCTNIAIGNACQLELSLKASASNQETLNWKVVLPSGSSKSEHTVINKHDLSINLTKSSVLPLNYVDTVTIVNGSKTDYYFNQPIFVDVLNRPLTTAVISNNTCKNEIKLGEQCSFNIQSNIDGAQGYLKLDLKDEPIGEISFSKVVVKGVKNQDIPANAAKGVRYPFTYTFSNTNTTLPATGVSFTNAFPAPDFTLDTANSSCNGITTIAANSSCTWKGTFTPGANGNKTMSSTLHYAEGSDVSLTSASQVTTIAITGTKNQDIPANAATGVRYPFTYTFSNTNTTLPATGVSFTNAFPAPDFTLDTANSSCNGITTIAANSSCTWKGTFTPGTDGNKTMSSTLHYAEGSYVSLSSSSQVLFATTPINTGPGVAENGWNWPTPRFDEAKQADSSPCPDAEYDKLTGLMWGKDGGVAGRKTWADASAYANTLSFCGYNDWRLPTVNELASLVNFSSISGGPAIWLRANGFRNILASTANYWSSTVYSVSGGLAWSVSMDHGNAAIYVQHGANYVLPVRGPTSLFASAGAVIQNTHPGGTGPGQWPATRFDAAKKADSSTCNDAEYDKLTGLMWAKNGSVSGQKNWADAKTYPNTLSLCGYNDWRLPTIKELASLVNFLDTNSPASWLNNNGFNNIQQDNYWSSTVDYYPVGSASAWNVYMKGW